MVYLQHCYITGPIRFCSKICNVGGRLIAAPTRSVLPNYRRKNFVAQMRIFVVLCSCMKFYPEMYKAASFCPYSASEVLHCYER